MLSFSKTKALPKLNKVIEHVQKDLVYSSNVDIKIEKDAIEQPRVKYAQIHVINAHHVPPPVKITHIIKEAGVKTFVFKKVQPTSVQNKVEAMHAESENRVKNQENQNSFLYEEDNFRPNQHRRNNFEQINNYNLESQVNAIHLKSSQAENTSEFDRQNAHYQRKRIFKSQQGRNAESKVEPYHIRNEEQFDSNKYETVVIHPENNIFKTEDSQVRTYRLPVNRPSIF